MCVRRLSRPRTNEHLVPAGCDQSSLVPAGMCARAATIFGCVNCAYEYGLGSWLRAASDVGIGGSVRGFGA